MPQTSRSSPTPHSIPRPLASLALLGALLAAVSLHAGISQGHAAAPPEAHSLTGWLLVAAPEMEDPRFARTVVLMLQHGADGAMGIVVNRPMGNLPIAALLEWLGEEGAGVPGTVQGYYGGPVEPGRGMVLHTPEYAIEGTALVANGIAATNQPDILRAIAAGSGPRRSLLTFGVAGWGPGQLEGEMAGGAWFTIPADAALVLETDPAQKWDRALARRRTHL
jgi:putative transcriptional regulator